MSAVEFSKFTPAEYKLLFAIAERAHDMTRDVGIEYSVIDAEMDISATNANGCPLDLERLSGFGSFEFAHDVLGIRRHIDRSTGKLTDCFIPRCAR